MTKAEHDQRTKRNIGRPFGSADERCGYREARYREHDGSRADGPSRAPGCYFATRRSRVRAGLHVLAYGSGFRAVQRWNAANGHPLTVHDGSLRDASRLPS